MAETILKVVKVFIGSPGGLEDERQSAKRIVEEVNQSHSEHWACQIKLVGWEATLPGYNRAQSLINQDLDKCEYFVGVLWDNWGSQPEEGDSRYTSGFEEEFERAKDRIEAGLMRDMALFFKDIKEVKLKNLHDTYEKVVQFREECARRRKPLFKEFKETKDFEQLFRATISEIGWRESRHLQAPPKESLEPAQPAEAGAKEQPLTESTGHLIEASPAKFITELLQKSSEWESTTPFEIARFRLIATSVGRSGNDELNFGNHDANLLFIKRNHFDFSDQEVRALAKVGVSGFDSQTVPLWHWIAKPSGPMGGINAVQFWAALGTTQQRLNAIRVLQCLGQGTPIIDEFFSRERVIKDWLLGERTSQEIAVALDFLQTNGDAEDLAVLRDLLEEIPAERKNDLSATIVALTANISLLDGFNAVIEFDPDPLAKSVVDRLFANPKSIPTEALERCLALKSDAVRKEATKLLNTRRAIDIGSAERLMTDSDPEIRLIAVKALAEQNKAPDESTIKKALILPKPRGLFGVAFGDVPDDRSYHERYRQSRLAKLKYEELRKKADNCSVFDHLEIATLYERFTRKCLREIRTNLDDAFKRHFETKISALEAALGSDEKTVATTRDLEKYLRTRLTSMTLDTLCAFGDGQDLDLVRRTLDQQEVNFSIPILQFLGRFGDWSDKERILAFSSRFTDNNSTLLSGWSDRSKPIASALYAIGKSRLLDLLRLDIGILIRRALIMKMSQSDIRSLDRDVIMSELNDKDDLFRKVLALKCVQAMKQSYISRLLDSYVNRDAQRYYNSVHWLDLGASMPRRDVKNVTEFELEKLR